MATLDERIAKAEAAAELAEASGGVVEWQDEGGMKVKRDLAWFMRHLQALKRQRARKRRGTFRYAEFSNE